MKKNEASFVSVATDTTKKRKKIFAHSLKITGPNCGACVRVLGMCEPNPAPISVDPECMKECMKAGDGSCVDCVEIYAKCTFGKGSQPAPGKPDSAFDAAEEIAKAQLVSNKDAPSVPCPPGGSCEDVAGTQEVEKEKKRR